MHHSSPSGAASHASSSRGILSESYQEMPYWWVAAPPDRATEIRQEIGGTVDVAVVGGGVTGSVAALHLARHGASVIVFDLEGVGEGAARRNAGFLGRTLKRSLEWLEGHEGADVATAVYRELDEALRGLVQFTREESIDCNLRQCGRVISANSETHLKLLIDDLKYMKSRLGYDYDVLGRHDMRTEIASEAYVGGVVVPDLGSLHPGLYHNGLVEAARAAGVRYVPRAEVRRIESDGPLKRVRTAAGDVTAEHVIVATNGYTSKGLGWFARRVIPFRGFMIATEELPAERIDRVLPNRRTYLDTKLNIDFIRPAPDSNRILFGGMTGSSTRSARGLAERLHATLVRILPDLTGVKVDFGWTGYCAGTFDFMPHIGQHDGIHFAMGYNFAGVPIGTHFGVKLARRILAQAGSRSVFERAAFRGNPLYRGSSGGSPWFVPLAMRFFDWRDARMARH
ncbi:MAG: NAD(P)/FAD-dependent oxidoreductase [Geminicoccaceae bacterium]